ncbi:MAG: exo-alpha-sialidase [Thermoguttaceae bacterium]
MTPRILGLVCLAGTSALPADRPPVALELVRVQKIWDQAKHNAFTDLLRAGEWFFCVFREGEGHVSPDGKIRILRSPDGNQWESVGLLEAAGQDLRDPKIEQAPDGRLMVLGGAAVREGSKPATSHRSFVSFSSDGTHWGGLRWVAPPDEWLWRITWFRGRAYGVAYLVSPPSRAEQTYGSRLYTSEDGLDFRPLLEQLCSLGGPTEATLRFDPDGTCYCLHRRDGRPSNTALLGTSRPPYTTWQWKDLGHYYGGPNLLQVPGGRWVAAGRLYGQQGPKTVLCELDVTAGKLIPLVTLPSGGDTSYPGLVWHDQKLWVSYYSSHEGKTSIYLAVLAVK